MSFGVISCLASVATMALASAAAGLHVGTCYPSFSAQGLGTVYVIKAGHSYRCPTARHWHSLTSLLRVLLSGTIRGSGVLCEARLQQVWSLLALLDGWRRVSRIWRWHGHEYPKIRRSPGDRMPAAWQGTRSRQVTQSATRYCTTPSSTP